MVNRFVVYDEDGELRRFATRIDADTFMKGQPQMMLRIIPMVRRKPVDLITLVGECPF
jgi:hypothetical protein